MASRAGDKKANKVGVCIMCRHVFQCSRLDKKTCSDRCRKAWQRYNESSKRDNLTVDSEASQMSRLIAIINRAENSIFGGLS